MTRLLLSILFSAAFLAPPVSAADARFAAIPSSTEITTEENVSIEFKVEVESMKAQIGDPQYNAKDFDEINVYQGSKGFSSSFVNGAISVSQSQTSVAVLHPRHEGRLVISNIRISVNGTELKAPDVTVEVHPAGTKIAGQSVGSGSMTGNPPPDKLPAGTV